MTARPLAGRVGAVVIGTSAGGVEALSVILPALPATFRLPVREADDKEPIEAGTVYFAPPDYHLLIEKDGTVALSNDGLVNFSRPSIDVLFESAAEVYGARLLGVILTGANSDGADGLAAVRGAGGFAVVQDPAEAQAAVMTEAALARTAVDYVLPLHEIAALLQRIDGN
jgi:two-component system chemotaxis response regulator CheB